MRSIIISGASSGIGKALALRYAAPGFRLALVGRDQRRLDDVARQCELTGAKATVFSLDIRDRSAVLQQLGSFDRTYPVDILIANAGALTGSDPAGQLERADDSHELLKTNVLGTQNTVHAVLPGMMERRRGQIALVSSLAAFIALPDCPSYCASKAAVLLYGLSLREFLREQGVKVSVICPGYVETPMSSREIGPQPFKMSADKAAKLIQEGLAHNRRLIVFPRGLGRLARLGSLMPDAALSVGLRFFRFSVR